MEQQLRPNFDHKLPHKFKKSVNYGKFALNYVEKVLWNRP